MNTKHSDKNTQKTPTRVLMLYNAKGTAIGQYDSVSDAVKRSGIYRDTINNAIWRKGKFKDGSQIMWVDIGEV